MSNATYDRDFYAWSQEQAHLLPSGKASEADLEHIAEACLWPFDQIMADDFLPGG